jgi:hypothetical protein
MPKFRLLAGQHEAKDFNKPILDAEGEPIPGRFEKRVWTATQTSYPVIESETDLVAKHGHQKFAYVEGEDSAQETVALKRKVREQEAELDKLRRQLAQSGHMQLPGDPTAENLMQSPSTAPGGQVSTGFQDGLDDADEETLDRVAERAGLDVKEAKTRDDKILAIRQGRREAAADASQEAKQSKEAAERQQRRNAVQQSSVPTHLRQQQAPAGQKAGEKADDKGQK